MEWDWNRNRNGNGLERSGMRGREGGSEHGFIKDSAYSKGGRAGKMSPCNCLFFHEPRGFNVRRDAIKVMIPRTRIDCSSRLVRAL